MPKVSIIMPSLNVAKYIEQCIKSVIDQTLSDIEIICVDAGSTDGTCEIIKKYAEVDSRIRIINSQKKSYGYQMNIGIAAATGEYIGIVETDDRILPEMYEVLYNTASDNELDYVKSDYYSNFFGKFSKVHLSDLDEYYNIILTDKEREIIFAFWVTNWVGIYNRDFLLKNNIRHNESPGASYQDTGFLVQVMTYAERCMWIDRAFYIYTLDNLNSSVNSKSKMMCLTEEHNYIEQLLVQNNKSIEISYLNFYRMLGNLSTYYRIDDSLKSEFAEFIAREYNCRKNNIHTGLFINAEKVMREIKKIAENPQIETNKILNIKALPELTNIKRIFLYGTGNRAHSVTSILFNYKREIFNKIAGYIVSEKTEVESFYNKPVITLENVDFCDDNFYIIVAVKKNTEAYHQIVNALKNQGIKKYIDSDGIMQIKC